MAMDVAESMGLVMRMAVVDDGNDAGRTIAAAHAMSDRPKWDAIGKKDIITWIQ